jgi:hypothetical protein
MQLSESRRYTVNRGNLSLLLILILREYLSGRDMHGRMNSRLRLHFESIWKPSRIDLSPFAKENQILKFEGIPKNPVHFVVALRSTGTIGRNRFRIIDGLFESRWSMNSNPQKVFCFWALAAVLIETFSVAVHAQKRFLRCENGTSLSHCSREAVSMVIQKRNAK